MIVDVYPLSPLQQGMLFHTLSQQGSGVDIQQLLIELPEPLDVTRLQQAWKCVAARHAILRTKFRWKDLAQPLQEVHAAVALPWKEEDWRGISNGERDQRFCEFLNVDRCRAFDMGEAPLWRLTFFYLGVAETRLVVTVHHALLDGRSLAMVVREVFSGYDALCRGEELTLPVPRPYRDYVDWLQQQDFGKAEAFWRQRLAGLPAQPALAVDHGASTAEALRTGRGTANVALSSHITSGLRALAQANQITLTTVVQGAWAIVLSRNRNAPDVVFGVVRACRSALAGADQMIGLFSNTLPLRARIDPSAQLLPWLRELQAQWRTMRSHQYTPLGRVQAWCQASPAHPLFDSIVMFEGFQLESLLRSQGGRWSGVKSTLLGQSIYPLNLLAYDGAELRLELACDRARFDTLSVDRIVNQLRVLLEAIATNPQRKLEELPPTPPAERRRLRLECTNAEAANPKDPCLHQLFERQVARTPDAIAVTFDRARLTYRDLNRRANQVAHRLRQLPIGPGALIGIYLHRSPHLPASLLGVLKAGAAFVPIDPTYPVDRVRFMLDDANATVVLTEPELIDTLPPLAACRVICVDRMDETTAVADQAHSAPDGNLAYVMYTSGSTGAPKGVMISHRAIVNNIQWMRSTFPMDHRDRVLQKTAISFDPAVWEIFLPLAVGAQVIIPSARGHQDPNHVIQLMLQHHVTILNCIPSFLRMLLETPGFESCRSLRHCFCGGEVMPEDLVRQFYATHTAELHNFYGPTEASITSLFYSVPRSEIPSIIPIGRPVTNTEAYLLDRDRNPAPVGVPGELYLGGRQLAAGYYNRPELTGERFVEVCVSGLSNARLYRTGDKARLLPDGNVEFLGRFDHQVKLRGFRIELGEIETTLRRNATVRDCAVVLHKNAAGLEQLRAYVVSRCASSPSADELHTYLKSKLPDYMVPGKILLLDALPLAPNGKIDRQALRPPEETTRDCAMPYCAPRTPTETLLVDVWRRVLGVQQVGIHDNFFELGGHSLMTVRLVDAINQDLCVKLGVTEIFQYPTIAQLADAITQHKPAKRKPIVVRLQDGIAEPAIYIIGGGSFLARLAQLMGSRHPVFGVEVPWPLAWRHALEANQRSAWPDIEQFVAPYAATLSSHAGLSPCVLVGYSFGGLMAFEVAHQLQKLGGKVELVVLLDARAQRPARYRVAWHKWRRRESTQQFLRSVVAALKKLAPIGRSLIGETSKVALLSGITDEDGVGVPWHLIARLYKSIQRSYRPCPIECRGLLCLAQDAYDKDALDNSAGWSNLFARGLEIISVPGDHHSMVRAERNIERLSAEISNVLQRDLATVK